MDGSICYTYYGSTYYGSTYYGYTYHGYTYYGSTYYGYTYHGYTYYGTMKAAMHCSIWVRVHVPLMTDVLHARWRLQASASSVGDTPYFSASATYLCSGGGSKVVVVVVVVVVPV